MKKLSQCCNGRGLICLTCHWFNSRPHIGCQKCDSRELPHCPRDTGELAATELGQASLGTCRGYHNREEPHLPFEYNIFIEISHQGTSQHMVWHYKTSLVQHQYVRHQNRTSKQIFITEHQYRTEPHIRTSVDKRKSVSVIRFS